MEVKKALEELNMYKKSRKRMAYIKLRMAELRERMFSLAGGDSLGVQTSSAKDDKIVAIMDKLRNLQHEMMDEEIRSLCLQNDIERKIYKLREPYCSILRGYYCEEKNYEKLAVYLHYTFDSVKQIKKRAVLEYSKLPQLYDDSYYITSEID